MGSFGVVDSKLLFRLGQDRASVCAQEPVFSTQDAVVLGQQRRWLQVRRGLWHLVLTPSLSPLTVNVSWATWAPASRHRLGTGSPDHGDNFTWQITFKEQVLPPEKSGLPLL